MDVITITIIKNKISELIFHYLINYVYNFIYEV